MLPYYLERPVWGPSFPRFIAFANAQTLTIIDRLDNSKFAVQLAELPSVAALTNAELRIAADPEQGAILFSFLGDRALGQAKSFAWELHTGLVSPLEGDFQMHLQARGLGEGEWAHHHGRNRSWGEGLAWFLVRRGLLSQRESEELTFLPTFINLHVPSSERVDTRLLAYSSRTTLVVKDLLTDQANITDLRALRPDDYHAIADIDMYANFYGDEVCFVLTGHGISPVAYIWRAGVGLLGSTEVPTELNTLGWNPMRHGTPRSIFRDIRLETEEVSASLPRQAVFWLLLGAEYSFGQWSLLLFSSFGLPYVLSHALIINRAQSLAKAGNKMINAAEVSGVQFVLLSLLCIFFLSYIVPAHLAWGDLPLPWVNPASPRADRAMLVVLIVFVPATLVLALLNGLHVRVLLREMQGVADNVSNGRRTWGFWGFSAQRHPGQSIGRYPLHIYATLAGCLMMMTYLIALRLRLFLDVEIAWLMFLLIVLIPYTAARPLSLLVARHFASPTTKP
ncbi:MAG: hypothetical protein DDT38_01381 [Firmicutes bacterium]|nr:hypothetical protein [candidate division NPL-UPA2 bacterium]